MARLRIYTVHIDPSLPHPLEAPEFVAEGFNTKAFIFTGLWMLYRRLWWQALVFFLYEAVMMALYSSGALSPLGIGIIDLGVHLLIGFEANEWLRRRMEKQGYLTTDIATGDSPIRAQQRFFDRYFAAHPGATA